MYPGWRRLPDLDAGQFVLYAEISARDADPNSSFAGSSALRMSPRRASPTRSQLQAHKVAIAIINFNRGSELDSNFNNAHYNIVGAYLTATNTSSSRNMQKRRTRWAHRFRFARLPEARSLLEVEHPDRRGDRRASGRRSHRNGDRRSSKPSAVAPCQWRSALVCGIGRSVDRGVHWCSPD